MMKALAILVLLAGAVALFVYRNGPPHPDTPAVVAQIRQLNQLATVRYTVQKVVGIREPSYPLGEESILLVVQARVEAGVDLANLDAKAVEASRDGVTVRLPPSQVLHVSIDEGETRVWDRTKTWWTPWVPYSPALESKARQQGLEAARQAALEMGILKQAQRNAADSIRTLLTLAGIQHVNVIPADAS